jgi:Flp pilus assembly protein TadG
MRFWFSSTLARLARSERGTAFVEFAIVSPFLVLLLVGLVDFSRYAYDGLLAANAARAAVQYGAQNTVTADDTNGMKTAASTDSGGLAVTTTPTVFCEASGVQTPCTTAGAVYYVQVVTSGTFTPLVNYPGLPSNVTVSAQAVMRVASQ